MATEKRNVAPSKKKARKVGWCFNVANAWMCESRPEIPLNAATSAPPSGNVP